MPNRYVHRASDFGNPKTTVPEAGISAISRVLFIRFVPAMMGTVGVEMTRGNRPQLPSCWRRARSARGGGRRGIGLDIAFQCRRNYCGIGWFVLTGASVSRWPSGLHQSSPYPVGDEPTAMSSTPVPSASVIGLPGRPARMRLLERGHNRGTGEAQHRSDIRWKMQQGPGLDARTGAAPSDRRQCAARLLQRRL